MCVNYLAPPRHLLADHFNVIAPEEDWPTEIWQDYAAPILLGGAQGRRAMVATYGFVPKAHLPPGVRFSTMNARAETVGSLKSYRRAWQQAQLCLVPMLGFFEPCYESGKAERYQIGLRSAAPFAVAGLWRSWDEADGRQSHSFTQITINADQHALLRRMHKPEDEKRSLVIVAEADYDHWLNCADPEIARSFLRDYAAEALEAKPSPKPPTRRSKAVPASGSLFDPKFGS